ncbi:MAG: hypothetical protein HY830_23025, partial [Actinobacteria bacterium]|nr:hypothetical protein [Actinomycetota bacterium]
MATNLLLEGDDLEALLLRAAAEGGANARILRAEKVRQGGFMGFFAREHFEVAVEIPDAVQVQDPDGDAAAGAVGAPAERRPGQQAGRPQGRQEGRQPGQPQGRQPQGRPAARPVRAYDEADDEQVAALVAALSQDRTPEPGMLAAEGLLGLADRVSAAERAAAGGTGGRPAGPDDSVDVRSGPPNALAGARARSAFERYLPQSSPAPSAPEAG